MFSTRDWQAIWQNPHPPFGLRLMAVFYAFGWRVYEMTYRLGLRKRKRMAVPVIGVGSLQVGGTGKTPTTIALVQSLRAEGLRVVVLCSGYGGRRFQDVAILEPGSRPDPFEVGEEPVLILQSLGDVPTVVGRRRVLTAEAAIERFHPDLIVLDDGFQHLPLARALDLVLLDANAPFSNGYCLPAGALREPRSGLKRASAVILIREGVGEKADGGMDGRNTPTSQLFNVSIPVFDVFRQPLSVYRMIDGTIIRAEELRDKTVVTLAGIARPERFESVIENMGVVITERLRFPDHHAYRPDDLGGIPKECWILTTEKDAVKLKALPTASQYSIYVLASCVVLDDRLIEWMLKALGVEKPV